MAPIYSLSLSWYLDSSVNIPNCLFDIQRFDKIGFWNLCLEGVEALSINDVNLEARVVLVRFVQPDVIHQFLLKVVRFLRSSAHHVQSFAGKLGSGSGKNLEKVESTVQGSLQSKYAIIGTWIDFIRHFSVFLFCSLWVGNYKDDDMQLPVVSSPSLLTSSFYPSLLAFWFTIWMCVLLPATPFCVRMVFSDCSTFCMNLCEPKMGRRTAQESSCLHLLNL